MNSSPKNSGRAKACVGIGLLLWIVGVVAGVHVLTAFEAAPGRAAAPPPQWPTASRIARASDQSTLLVFVHPHCPCSRATLDQLDSLLTRAPGRVDPHVVFVEPREVAADWHQGENWRRAQAIPGVQVHRDLGGAEAEQFGSATSGQVIVYDSQGRLGFNGGITAARGQMGDNPGSGAIISLLNEGRSKDANSAVFGCPLQRPSDDELNLDGEAWSLTSTR